MRQIVHLMRVPLVSITMISDFIAHPIQSIARWTGSPSHKYIYAFSEGSADDKKLLGNKGSLLCEMTRMGLPVPPGFVVTTEACNEYFIENKVFSADLTRDIQKGKCFTPCIIPLSLHR